MKVTLMLLAALVTLRLDAQNPAPFQNPDLPLDQRVNSILSLMTLEEKLACLNTNTGVPRLGIPNTGNSEGLHGLVRRAQDTGGRIPNDLVQSGNRHGGNMGPGADPAGRSRAGIRGSLRDTAREDSRPGVWGPNADLARDPRWGRNEESYGEDPFLTATMSVAFIRGMQGDDPKYWQAASLMKHFLANSNETTRGGSSSDFDEAGMAITHVLFGDYNPAGRLNKTWPKSVDQLPPIDDYDIRNGHTCMYFRGGPLYPFGYGLSYTTFHYSKLRFSASRLRSEDEMMVSVDVSNTGSRAGDEVVRLYVKHLASHVQHANSAEGRIPRLVERTRSPLETGR